MTRIHFTAAFSLLFFMAACQPDGKGEPENKADTAAVKSSPEKLLELAETKFNALESYACRMKVYRERDSTVNKTAYGLAFTGEYFYSKGKYHIDLGEDLIICDGDSVMSWFRAFGKVEVKAVDSIGDFTLAGMYALHKKAGTVKADGRESGVDRYTLLSPEEKGFFQHKALWIDPRSGLIAKYALYSSDAWIPSFLYELDSARINEQLDPALFVIDRELVRRIRNGEIPPDEHHGHSH